MNQTDPVSLETDPRFPSGPWTGFFLQAIFPPGRHQMELRLTFKNGTLTGEGRDWVGDFLIRGRYNVGDGTCSWIKSYPGRHSISYKGYNEGKGIWGLWEIAAIDDMIYQRGGFHIWPEGMADPTNSHLTEKADLPARVTEELETSEPLLVPVK